jgi:hypothetical protein
VQRRAANDNGQPQPLQLSLYTHAHALRFESWIRENPGIWALFERFTLEAIAAGMSHYSADAICHRIRWHVEIEVRDASGFKVNNNHVAFLARRFEKKHPAHRGFFRLRVRRSA